MSGSNDFFKKLFKGWRGYYNTKGRGSSEYKRSVKRKFEQEEKDIIKEFQWIDYPYPPSCLPMEYPDEI